jgi:hypothetical protein
VSSALRTKGPQSRRVRRIPLHAGDMTGAPLGRNGTATRYSRKRGRQALFSKIRKFFLQTRMTVRRAHSSGRTGLCSRSCQTPPSMSSALSRTTNPPTGCPWSKCPSGNAVIVATRTAGDGQSEQPDAFSASGCVFLQLAIPAFSRGGPMHVRAACRRGPSPRRGSSTAPTVRVDRVRPRRAAVRTRRCSGRPSA